MKASRLQMIGVLRQDEEIWSLYTRKEEYVSRNRDRYDRFLYSMSRHRDVFEPRASQKLIEKGYSCEYPEAQPFALCLTHDIDIVYESFLAKGFEILRAVKHGAYRHAAGIVPQLSSKRRPWCNFDEIAAIEEAFGASSTYFFQAVKDGSQEHTYTVDDLEQDICVLVDRGHDIGLHGGCEAYRDMETLLGEKRHLERVLNRTVSGYRNHFLKFQVPTTWDLLERAGFTYDTTLGYPDCIGFRNGMCHPFRPYDLVADREMTILEIPLAVMDLTLFSSMRLNMEQAWNHIERLINTVEQNHGVFTILWHNTVMAGKPLDLYRKILTYCHEKGAWMTNCREIEAWYRKSGMQGPASIGGGVPEGSPGWQSVTWSASSGTLRSCMRTPR